MTENKRFGAVLKFKEGVTPEQIARALNSIKDVLDYVGVGEDPMVEEIEPSLSYLKRFFASCQRT